MKVANILPVSFKGKIIDAHTHVGVHDNKTNNKSELDIFVKSNLPNNDSIEKMLVSDLDVLHGVTDEYNGNINTIKLFENNSKYALFASCSPKYGDVENIKKLYSEYPNTFIGLKFHPTIQKLALSSPKYEPYLEYADKHDLPCLFHTAVITDKNGKLTKEIEKYSDPELLYKLAQKHKRIPVIMAHLGAGWREAHDKTIDILIDSIKNNDANLYADISWVDIDGDSTNGHISKEHILKAVKRLKGIGEKNWTFGNQSYRLMFGSDAPLDRFNIQQNGKALEVYAEFIDDIKYAIRTDKDLCKDAEKIIEDLFYNNAKNLYLSGKNKALLIKRMV